MVDHQKTSKAYNMKPTHAMGLRASVRENQPSEPSVQDTKIKFACTQSKHLHMLVYLTNTELKHSTRY